MKLLKDIPQEKYNDTIYINDFLNSHDTIGNEKNVNYNGIFHIHWRGPIDNDKVILQIKSTLATQKVFKIYFWIEDNLTTMMSSGYNKLIQFHKYVEIKEFNKNIFNQATGNINNKEKIWSYYSRHHGDRRYKTDILRWVILNIYGGVYTDADTLLLRDLRDIKINNWSSKWGVDPYAECCILKLEKGSDMYEQMYLNNPNNPQCFLLIQNNLPEAFNYKYDNLTFTSLPSAFFDIVWNLEMLKHRDLLFLTFSEFEHFFENTDIEITLDNFFKGCFAYHWHNRWDFPELKNSFAGKLNQQFDKIIEQKYNIKPIKIFQQ